MIVILGDSHTSSLKDGYDLFSEDERRTVATLHGDFGIAPLSAGYRFLRPFFSQAVDGTIRFSRPFATARLEAATAAAGAKVDAIGPGDQHRYMFCLGAHGIVFCRHWRKHSPSDVAGKHYVSDAAFQHAVAHFSRHILSFFDAMLAMGVSFEVIFCCPQTESRWDVEEGLFTSPEEMGVFYSRFRKAYAAELAKRGIVFHEPPDELLDGAFLRPEFVSQNRPNDYHANPEYGKIMLRRVLGV